MPTFITNDAGGGRAGAAQGGVEEHAGELRLQRPQQPARREGAPFLQKNHASAAACYSSVSKSRQEWLLLLPRIATATACTCKANTATHFVLQPIASSRTVQVASNLSPEDKESAENAINKTISWLDDNQLGEVRHFAPLEKGFRCECATTVRKLHAGSKLHQMSTEDAHCYTLNCARRPLQVTDPAGKDSRHDT